MTLVDEYLRAVAILLPRAQRDDIVAELRDMILSRLEDRETGLGRALTEDEVEAVLREIGHPLVVAARYRGGPQHVVGPAIYPYWIFAIRIGVALQIALAAITFVVRSLGSGDIARAFGLAVASGVGGAVTLVGLATIVALAVERNAVHVAYLERWRVRDLRLLDVSRWDWEGTGDRFTSRSGRGMRRARSREARLASRGLGMMAIGAVLALWWLGVFPIDIIGSPGDLRQLGVEPGSLAATDWRGFFASLFWPGLAYAVAIAAQGALILAWPKAIRVRGVLDLAIGAGVIAVAVWIGSYSALAAAVHVDSLAAFAVRMKSMIRQLPPAPLASIVTLALAILIMGGLGRMGRGAIEILVGPRVADRAPEPWMPSPDRSPLSPDSPR